MKRITEKDFWEKVDRTSGPDACWIWIRALKSDGYGSCLFLGEQLAHRAAWKLLVGEIPTGLCVLHTCDNRKCVNPKHLFLGTRTDNNLDRDTKGRTARGDKSSARLHIESRPRGELNARSKLKDAEVLEIRRLYKTHEYSQYKLASIFHVSRSTIASVVRYESRKHLP